MKISFLKLSKLHKTETKIQISFSQDQNGRQCNSFWPKDLRSRKHEKWNKQDIQISFSKTLKHKQKMLGVQIRSSNRLVQIRTTWYEPKVGFKKHWSSHGPKNFLNEVGTVFKPHVRVLLQERHILLSRMYLVKWAFSRCLSAFDILLSSHKVGKISEFATTFLTF